jgi:hypothetical protein
MAWLTTADCADVSSERLFALVDAILMLVMSVLLQSSKLTSDGRCAPADLNS